MTIDRDPEHRMGNDRWSLLWLALAAFLLVAGSVAFIAYEDAQAQPGAAAEESRDSAAR